MFGGRKLSSKKRDKNTPLKGYHVITKYTVPTTPSKIFGGSISRLSSNAGARGSPRLATRGSNASISEVIYIESDDEFVVEPLNQSSTPGKIPGSSPLRKHREFPLDVKHSLISPEQLVIPKPVWRTTVKVGSVPKGDAASPQSQRTLPQAAMKIGEAPVSRSVAVHPKCGTGLRQSSIITSFGKAQDIAQSNMGIAKSPKSVAQLHQSIAPSKVRSLRSNADSEPGVQSTVKFSATLSITTSDPKKIRADYAKMVEAQRKMTPHKFAGGQSHQKLFLLSPNEAGVPEFDKQPAALSGGREKSGHKPTIFKNENEVDWVKTKLNHKKTGEDNSGDSPYSGNRSGLSDVRSSLSDSRNAISRNALTKNIEQKLLHNWFDNLDTGMSKRAKNVQIHTKEMTCESSEQPDSVLVLRSKSITVQNPPSQDNAQSTLDGRKGGQKQHEFTAKSLPGAREKLKASLRSSEKFDSDVDSNGSAPDGRERRQNQREFAAKSMPGAGVNLKASLRSSEKIDSDVDSNDSMRSKLRSARKLKLKNTQRRSSHSESGTSSVLKRHWKHSKNVKVTRQSHHNVRLSDDASANALRSSRLRNLESRNKVLRSKLSKTRKIADSYADSSLESARAIDSEEKNSLGHEMRRVSSESNDDKSQLNTALNDPAMGTEVSFTLSSTCVKHVDKMLPENETEKPSKCDITSCDNTKKRIQSENALSPRSSRSGRSLSSLKSPEERILEFIENDANNEECVSAETPHKNEDPPHVISDPSPVLLSKFTQNLSRKRERELLFEEKLEAKRQKMFTNKKIESILDSCLSSAKKKSRERRLKEGSSLSRRALFSPNLFNNPLRAGREESDVLVAKMQRPLFPRPQIIDNEDVIPVKTPPNTFGRALTAELDSKKLEVVTETVEIFPKTASFEQGYVTETEKISSNSIVVENSSEVTKIVPKMADGFLATDNGCEISRLKVMPGVKVLDQYPIAEARLNATAAEVELAALVSGSLMLKVKPDLGGTEVQPGELFESTPLEQLNHDDVADLTIGDHELHLEKDDSSHENLTRTQEKCARNSEMAAESKCDPTMSIPVLSSCSDTTSKDIATVQQPSLVGEPRMVKTSVLTPTAEDGIGKADLDLKYDCSTSKGDMTKEMARRRDITMTSQTVDQVVSTDTAVVDDTVTSDLIPDEVYDVLLSNITDGEPIVFDNNGVDCDVTDCSPRANSVQHREEEVESLNVQAEGNDVEQQGSKQTENVAVATQDKILNSFLDVSKFFDDEDDVEPGSCLSSNAEIESSDELPEMVASDELSALKREDDIESNKNEEGMDKGLLDELPDLSSRRRECQSSSKETTTDLFARTFAPGDASHDTIIDSDWITELDEFVASGSRPSRNAKTRFRSVELPTSLNPQHSYKDLLVDSAFLRTYQKHSASLKRLAREKKKDDEVNKMEELLLSDLKKGGFRHTLEREEEEMGDDIESELNRDEKTKRAKSLMKKDWGTLPQLPASCQLFKQKKLKFCLHNMHLSSCFDEKSFQDLQPRLRRDVLRFKSAENVVIYPGIVSSLLKKTGTRMQTYRWLLDVVQCHPESNVVHEIVQSNLREKNFDQSPFTFSLFKSALINSGISEDIFCRVSHEQEQKDRPDYGVCSECSRMGGKVSPRNTFSVVRIMSTTFHVFPQILLQDDQIECSVFLLLLLHDPKLESLAASELFRFLSLFWKDIKDWDSLKFLIVRSLLERCCQLNVLESIVTRLRFIGDREHEISRITAFAVLNIHILGLEPQDVAMEEYEDLEVLADIVDDFNPDILESHLLPDKQEDHIESEKRSYYHLSLLLPVLSVCIGDRCEDAATHAVLDGIWSTVRTMSKRIRDNGVIYRSEVKYDLCVFAKRLRILAQKAPKQNKASIFKYLRSAPVQEEIVNVSAEAPDSSESSDENID